MDLRGRFIDLHTIRTALLDLAAPRVCIACSRPLNLNEEHLCIACRAQMPYTRFENRTHNPMADRLNARLQEGVPEILGKPYAYASALFFYRKDSPYARIPQHLKYRSGLAAGRHFAAELGRLLAGSGHFAGVDLIVPVPLHPLRRFRRGYNQAEIIAQGIASQLDAPVRTDLLSRARRTRSQTKLSVEEKILNVQGAFCCRGGLQGVRHVLLVDDTFTTGATLSACCAALLPHLEDGARVSVATLSYVSGD